jgi:hypothetical protein
MSVISNSGKVDWSEIVYFGMSLFSQIMKNHKLPLNKELTNFIKNHSKKVKKSKLSNECILRISMNRVYYGFLQLLIDYFNINRTDFRNSIHTDIKIIMKKEFSKQFCNKWKNLYDLRIWADYKPTTIEKRSIGKINQFFFKD